MENYQKVGLLLFIAILLVTTVSAECANSTFIQRVDSSCKLDNREYDGVFNGYTWGTTSWVTNTTIVTGLGDVGLVSSRKLEYLVIENKTEVTRTVLFKNTTLIDAYLFDGNSKDIETVPVDHTICFLNGQGLIFEYLISGVKYNGVTESISSPFTLGKMKLVFEEGYYLAKIFNQAADKIQIKYRITSDNQCFDVRLFDPEVKVKNEIKDNKDGTVLIGSKKINYTDRYCVLVGTNRIDCVKNNDGLHKPDKKSFKGCQKEGGMNCYILILSEDLKSYSLSKVNSDKFVEGKTKTEVKQT